MNPLLEMSISAGFITLSIIAGIFIRAVQSGKRILNEDGEVREVPALGPSVVKSLLHSVGGAFLAFCFVGTRVTVTSDVADAALLVLATLAGALTGFAIAARSGYSVLIGDSCDQSTTAPVVAPSVAAAGQTE
jgi:hypothetical protein